MFVNVATALTELRAAGIAVEREGYGHATPRQWKFVTDCSVRDADTGAAFLMVGGARLDAIELVSPVLSGEAGLVAIETVCAALARAGAKVNKTCGLHVHHGALVGRTGESDPALGRPALALGLANLAVLARLVNRFEAVIDGCLPLSRRAGSGNRYIGAFASHELSEIAQATTFASLFHLNRYKNLNLAALGRHGTVEFRQHSGTVEASKVCAWVMLTQGLVECAAATTRGRKSAVKLPATADSLDNLMRAAGLRSCAPHGHVVAPAFATRARAASAYFAARAREFGVVNMAVQSARRSRAARAGSPVAAPVAGLAA
jgi:hypothetical protein